MTEDWQFQVRMELNEDLATMVRSDPGNPALGTLPEILSEHRAVAKCQFDAFAEYVAEAEAHGAEKYPLHKWTKATIEDPAKKAKYLKSFTLYVDGNEVYPKEHADALEAALGPLVDAGILVRVSKYDTNPENNPQPPPQYR